MARKGDSGNLKVQEMLDFADPEVHDPYVTKTKGGTAADLQDMQRMGRVQELRVCLPLFELRGKSPC